MAPSNNNQDSGQEKLITNGMVCQVKTNFKGSRDGFASAIIDNNLALLTPTKECLGNNYKTAQTLDKLIEPWLTIAQNSPKLTLHDSILHVRISRRHHADLSPLQVLQGML